MCKDKSGHKFGGRRCCQKISPKFRLVEAELFNLCPETGAINESHNSYEFVEFTKMKNNILATIWDYLYR